MKITKKTLVKNLFSYLGDATEAKALADAMLPNSTNKPDEASYDLGTAEIMQALSARYQDSDSGKSGKVYECAIRSYISGRLQCKVKPQGRNDITFTFDGSRFPAEIKTACGEVEMADKAQYIIYCPVVDLEFPAELQGYVFTRKEWQNFLDGYTGRGKFLREDKARGHLHIQSFYVSETVRPKASKPIASYIWQVCDEQPTVEEFFER